MAGERWIFLRGLARSKEHWGGLIEQFSSRVPDDAVEALDLCGNGTERARSVPASIAQFTDDLRSRSELLRQGSVRLVAISFGGMVAADWASRHPQEVHSLTLINSSDRARSAFWERLSPAFYPELLWILLARPEALERERGILARVSNLPEQQRDVLARRFSELEPPTLSSFLAQIRAALKFSGAPDRPNVPVLLLNSLGDRLVSPICSERWARAWGAQLRTHPWAGHDLPIDDPEWVIEQILAQSDLG